MLTTWWGGEPEIEIPIARRQATAIYASRSDARARIAKSSPTLQHSESWLETLVSLHEYMPPGVWWIVNALTSCLTLADIWFSGDGAGFDGDTWWRIPSHAHNTLLGLLSLLLAFRTSQAYDRWWEARKLWGQIVNSTRNIASNAAIFMTSLERKRDVIKATICFAWCTKASLRGVRPTADELRELTTDEMRRNMVRPYPGPPERRPTLHLTEKEAYDEMIKSSPAETFEHLPMMMIDEIKSGIRDELEQHAIEKGASETHEGWKIVLGADIKVRMLLELGPVQSRAAVFPSIPPCWCAVMAPAYLNVVINRTPSAPTQLGRRSLMRWVDANASKRRLCRLATWLSSASSCCFGW